MRFKFLKTIMAVMVLGIFYDGFVNFVNGDDTEFILGMGMLFLMTVPFYYVFNLWWPNEK